MEAKQFLGDAVRQMTLSPDQIKYWQLRLAQVDLELVELERKIALEATKGALSMPKLDKLLKAKNKLTAEQNECKVMVTYWINCAGMASRIFDACHFGRET